MRHLVTESLLPRLHTLAASLENTTIYDLIAAYQTQLLHPIVSGPRGHPPGVLGLSVCVCIVCKRNAIH